MIKIHYFECEYCGIEYDYDNEYSCLKHEETECQFNPALKFCRTCRFKNIDSYDNPLFETEEDINICIQNMSRDYYVKMGNCPKYKKSPSFM